MGLFQANQGRVPSEYALTARARYVGEYVEFDLDELLTSAFPKYAGGTGEGVSGEVVEALLDRMIEVLGFNGSSDADEQLRQVLQLAQGLLKSYEAKRSASASILARLLPKTEGVPEPDGEIEILREAMEAPMRVFLYR